MKKILLMIALFGLPLCMSSGCGPGGVKEIEASSDEDSSMSDAQYDEYKKQMEEYQKAGGGGSQRPGN